MKNAVHILILWAPLFLGLTLVYERWRGQSDGLTFWQYLGRYYLFNLAALAGACLVWFAYWMESR